MSSGQSQVTGAKRLDPYSSNVNFDQLYSHEVYVQHGVLGYGVSNGVTAAFFTRPKVTTHMHAFAGGRF